MNNLPSDIIYELTTFLPTKDIITLQSCNKKLDKIIKNNKYIFNIININNRKTKDIIKKIEEKHKMDTNIYTYFISEDNDKIHFMFIPNILKYRFIESKIIILPHRISL